MFMLIPFIAGLFGWRVALRYPDSYASSVISALGGYMGVQAAFASDVSLAVALPGVLMGYVVGRILVPKVLGQKLVG